MKGPGRVRSISVRLIAETRTERLIPRGFMGWLTELIYFHFALERKERTMYEYTAGNFRAIMKMGVYIYGI